MAFLPYLKLIRPSQWLKNLMLFFPPFLGGAILNPGVLTAAFLPLAAFCFTSSSTYVLNDILDARTDLNHPVKKLRPIPARKVSKINAACLAAVLLLAGIMLGFFVSGMFLAILISYFIVSSAYSLKLKQLPIIDLFCISAGFLLRLQAGGEAFGIKISEWLFLCVFLLAIFLSTGKRLHEKNMLGSTAVKHRQSLESYPEGFLEGTMYLTGATVLVCYTMYVISRHGPVYAVLLCTFGLLRYILRVKSGLGGDPTESLLRDFPLLVTGILWAVLVGWSIYG